MAHIRWGTRTGHSLHVLQTLCICRYRDVCNTHATIQVGPAVPMWTKLGFAMGGPPNQITHTLVGFQVCMHVVAAAVKGSVQLWPNSNSTLVVSWWCHACAPLVLISTQRSARIPPHCNHVATWPVLISRWCDNQMTELSHSSFPRHSPNTCTSTCSSISFCSRSSRFSRKRSVSSWCWGGSGMD